MGIKSKKIKNSDVVLPNPPNVLSNRSSAEKKPRLHSFEIIIYSENISGRGIVSNLTDYNSFDSLVSLLKTTLTVNHYLISPLHYHDYDDDGNVKKAHYHVYVTFSGNRSFESVATLFEAFKVLPTNVAPMKGSKTDCFKYSCHLNQADKWLYDVNDIVCDNIEFWQPHKKNDKIDVTMCIVDDLLAGRNLYSMAKCYGRDFVIHFKCYSDFVSELKFRSKLEDENLLNEEIKK